MIHNPVELGHDKNNSNSQFIYSQLGENTSGTEILIILLYLAGEQFNWIYAMFTVQRIYHLCSHVAGGVKLFSTAAGAGGFKP